jgi:F-type H+-transporting ATPase subunit b
MEKLINDFSFGLFMWQAIILLVLILLMAKYAWRPIINALNDREEGIKNALDAAEKAKEEMANITANNEKILAEARAERDGILKEARDMKESIINDARDAAGAETEKMMKQAQEAIIAEKNAAVAEMKNQIASMSISVAEKVLREELSNADKQKALVNDLIKDVNLN